MTELVKDFRMASHAPWWARKLGLTLDWQSKPSDRERTYHSDGRDVELVVGRLGNRWAFSKDIWSEYTSLHVGCPWLHVYWRIGRGSEPPVGEMSVSWGFTTDGDGSLFLRWGEWLKIIALNPFHWDGYEAAKLTAYGQWDATQDWTDEGKEILWYEENHPYTISSIPHYAEHHHEGPRVSIETWEAEASCRVERTIRTRKWLPFLKRVQYYVEFRLNNEVGPRSGSWKGGTIGFSEELLPGDRIADVVNRAAGKGRGR